MASGFGPPMARRKVFPAVPRSRGVRRSYEAEDVDLGRQETKLKEVKECFIKMKEKDLVISELQDQLDFLQKPIVPENPTSKVATMTKQRGHVAARGTSLIGPKGLLEKASNRGGAAATSLTARSKASVIGNEKCERVVSVKATAPTTSTTTTTTTSNRLNTADDHVRRLTNELAKLQADYARVRAVLQTATVPAASSRPMTPLSMGEVDPEVSVGINGRANSEVDCSEQSSFRKEIFRLKEELLTVHQKMNGHLEDKSAALEELRHLKEDHVTREAVLLRVISERESVESRLRLNVEDLERRLAEAEDSKRTLRKRAQGSEKEASELKEFLREEHESLSESLREVEGVLAKQVAEGAQLRETLKSKEERCDYLTADAERSQARVHLLEAELKDTQDKARERLRKQGAELNGCSHLVEQIYQVLNIGTGVVSASTLVSAILEADTAGCIDSKVTEKDENLVSKLKTIERAVTSLSNQLNSSVSALEMKEAERLVLDTDLFTAINRSNELEGEMMVMSTERQRLADENDLLRTQFRDSQNRLKESWRNLGDRIDANQRAEELGGQLDRERRTLRKVRADNAELETLLNRAVDGDQGLQDEFTLRRQIASLRQEVFDKQDEMEANQTKLERHRRILKDNLAKAEGEVHRLKAIVDGGQTYPKTVPGTVQTEDKLKHLGNELAVEEIVDVTETEGK